MLSEETGNKKPQLPDGKCCHSLEEKIGDSVAKVRTSVKFEVSNIQFFIHDHFLMIWRFIFSKGTYL